MRFCEEEMKSNGVLREEGGGRQFLVRKRERETDYFFFEAS